MADCVSVMGFITFMKYICHNILIC